MTLFGTADLGIDAETGLEKQLQIWGIDINGKTEEVIVSYDVVLLSPTGVTVKVIESNNYRRYDKQAVIDANGIELSAANLKFTYLKNSAVGQGILYMISLDVANYPNLEQN